MRCEVASWFWESPHRRRRLILVVGLAVKLTFEVLSTGIMCEMAQYDYDLPRELIAQFPLASRADARLLIVDRSGDALRHAHVRDLPEILRPGDCLVLNDTRVV